jgi:beta-lactamase regulating signal transducer with metallopeptidase domain
MWFIGVVARLGWLIAGQRRLRRLAARGTRVENDPALDRARTMAPPATLAPHAPARVSVVSVADAGPCAFGWVNVCVLVPVALCERPAEERLAVYLHELAHMLQAQDPDPSPSKVPGFRHDGRDPTGGVSTQNTYLVLAKCQAMIERVFQ